MSNMVSQVDTDYNGYHITTDKRLMQPDAIHRWLSQESYWAKDIPFETVKMSFDHSYCIAAIKDGDQVAYGRLITDYATYAYLADVYVTEPHRGRGLSKEMMRLLFDLDWVKKLRNIGLATRDAHELYAKSGFTPLREPDRYMQILRQDIYTTAHPLTPEP